MRWDYGHWVKYVSERRVSSDGAALRTRVPHRLARALLAPSERETVGLLRMLNCGSGMTAYDRLLGRDQEEFLVAQLVCERLPGGDAKLSATKMISRPIQLEPSASRTH